MSSIPSRLASVKPTLKRPNPTRDGMEFLDLPVLPRVPVVFPRAGDFFLSLPIVKGDRVLLVFADRSLDQWVDAGREGDAVDGRTHDLSDAVAIPGLYPTSEKLADAHAANMVLGKDGGIQIHLKPAGEIHLGSENAADFVSLAGLTLTELASLVTQVNAMITIFNANVVLLNAEGALLSGYAAAAPLSAPSSVAASKVKAD